MTEVSLTRSNRLSRLAADGVALVVLASLCAVAAWWLRRYAGEYYLGRPYLVWQGLLLIVWVFVPLCATFFARGAVRLAFAITTALVAIAWIVALVVQFEAYRQVGQRVSLMFVVDNWPVIEPFVPWWGPAGLSAAILGGALAGGWAVRRLARRVPPLLGTTALGMTLLVAAAASWSMPEGREKLHWEPFLATAGMLGTDVDPERAIELAERERSAIKRYDARNAVRSSAGGADPLAAKNVIVFMGESTVPSRMSVLGASRVTTPFLDRLAAQMNHSVRRTGWSTCSESVCGVTSTFLSRRYSDTSPGPWLGLGDVLQREGWDVRFVLVSDHRRYLYGQYHAFLRSQATSIFDYVDGTAPINSDALAVEGAEALPLAGDRPTLVFVFFFSTHVGAEEEPRFARYGPVFAGTKDELYRRRRFSDEEREHVRNLYDNKVLQLDHYMRRTWETLESKGYTQDALLLFLGDHGEALGERGRVGHGMLTDEGLRIPVVAMSDLPLAPWQDVPVEQVDIAPTLLDMLDIPVPAIWQGRSLLSKKREVTLHETGAERNRDGRVCQVARGPILGFDLAKVARCTTRRGEVDYQLHDLQSDQQELVDLWPESTAALRNEAAALLDASFELAPVEEE